ncbi:hypothetical protein HY632_04130 [Candidatus Uhrbacteria bacterium]|nr:hypothetical protein [Candidatus Uhrbacteria bacterium]
MQNTLDTRTIEHQLQRVPRIVFGIAQTHLQDGRSFDDTVTALCMYGSIALVRAIVTKAQAEMFPGIDAIQWAAA